jgi:hypothetical protein
MGLILKLNNVRLSFPNLDEPDYFKPGVKSRPNEQRRWSAAFHILKSDKVQIDAVTAALQQVAKDKWEKKWETAYNNAIGDPKGCCWQDGKRKDQDDVFILSTHRSEKDGRPIVFDTDMSPIYTPDNQLYPGKAGRLYSGCYVNAKVEFWAQENDSGKGLRATLQIIQRFKDGDAFGGSSPVKADDFSEIADGADADDLG